MKIFVDQFFRITLDTGIDLTDATALKIKYITPKGARGEWTAVIDEVDNTKMNYDNPGVVDAGQWKVWGKATFTAGNIPGEPTYFNVYNEGE